jgi:hypothetical protein
VNHAAAVAFLEEHPDATIEDAGLAASCLIALPGSGYREAAQTSRHGPEQRLAGERRRHSVSSGRVAQHKR